MNDGLNVAELDLETERLRESMGSAAAMAAGFDGELRKIGQSFANTGGEIAGLERGLSSGLRRAFDGVALGGMNLSDALSTVAQSMIRTTYSAAVRPVTDHFGGLLAGGIEGLVKNILPFADGAAFSQGRVTPFASGGVVSGPTRFAMRGGTGLMGEAGPEAIMPLARGPDGKLGVRGGGGGGGGTVIVNVSTPDAQSFQRSRGQIAAQMSRALSHGNRNR